MASLFKHVLTSGTSILLTLEIFFMYWLRSTYFTHLDTSDPRPTQDYRTSCECRFDHLAHPIQLDVALLELIVDRVLAYRLQNPAFTPTVILDKSFFA